MVRNRNGPRIREALGEASTNPVSTSCFDEKKVAQNEDLTHLPTKVDKKVDKLTHLATRPFSE